MAGTLKTASWIEGKRVALAGRLASMSRSEAARLIAAHGGLLASSAAETPAIVVVGREGWPLAKDGRPTRKLRQALRLARRGHDIEIVPEEELLARLHCPGGRLQRHFTLRELAEMLGTSVIRMDHWLRAGLITPVSTADGLRYFDFCQVAGAKCLCDLVRSGITTARLRHSLRQLRTWLGDIEHPLSQLTTLDDGGRLVVRLDSGQLADPDGQMLFDFWSQRTEAMPNSMSCIGLARSPEAWLDLASEAEDRGDWSEAARCYRQALLAGGPAPEACFNLANVLYAQNQYAAAGERYRQVLELDPDFWEAWNNLGTVLTFEAEYDEALTAFREALRLRPQFADAHYNIADTLEEMGRGAEAFEHWQAYLELEPSGPWSGHARQRLRAPDWC